MEFDFTCTDCNTAYKSAGNMLKHFAQHVTDANSIEASDSKKLNVPDLYPIAFYRNVLKGKRGLPNALDSEENVDSGIEDANPLLLCTVSIDDVEDFASKPTCREKHKTKRALKKYKCGSCSKTFGWSTDLKRHILTHTGERPFKCNLCDDSFTRKFLLQKHHAKQHFETTT